MSAAEYDDRQLCGTCGWTYAEHSKDSWCGPVLHHFRTFLRLDRARQRSRRLFA